MLEKKKKPAKEKKGKEGANKDRPKNVDLESLKKEIESILFASGKSVSVEDIVKLCKSDESSVRQAISELVEDYKSKDSPIMLVEEDDSYKLTVREKYLSLVQSIVSETELPKSIMETLAVIAFKHPILQSELVKIRSNKAYDHLAHLESTGYIKREKHGRTKKIHLTQKFFDYFDLPPNKVKEAFASFEAVSRAIEDKEKEAYLMKKELAKRAEEEKKRAEEEKEKLGALEVYDEPVPKTEPGVETKEAEDVKPGKAALEVYDVNSIPDGDIEIVDEPEQEKEPESYPADPKDEPQGEEQPEPDTDGDEDSQNGEEEPEEPEEKAEDEDVEESDDGSDDEGAQGDEDIEDQESEGSESEDDTDEQDSVQDDKPMQADEEKDDSGESISDEDRDIISDIVEKHKEDDSEGDGSQGPFVDKIDEDYEGLSGDDKAKKQLNNMISKKANELFKPASDEAGEDARDKEFDSVKQELEKEKDELEK